MPNKKKKKIKRRKARYANIYISTKRHKLHIKLMQIKLYMAPKKGI